MIKRIIEISQEKSHLKTQNNQLVIMRDGGIEAGRVPCEDIGVLIIDQFATTYSHAALIKLMRLGAVVVLCDSDHMPTGTLLPLSHHSTVVWRIRDQISCSRPNKKRLWKQLVVAKIENQAKIIESNQVGFRRLKQLAKNVRSGDPENIEAQAAKVYWKHFVPDSVNFSRNQLGRDCINSFLNYGYAILRAAISRSIVAAGLVPSVGLQHKNRGNPFCLSDDLIEPFRPLVDFVARELFEQGFTELNKESKRELIELLFAKVTTEDRESPLLISIQILVNSLVKCYEGESNSLTIPNLPKFIDSLC